jgi:hypothetical protein
LRPSLALAAILLLALAVRLAVAWTQVYVVYLDETFQYFEQAHRLAFGSGVVPWEFIDGARSWLLPGLIAGVMRATSVFSADPMLYVRVTRSLCVVLSLSVVYVGYCLARQRDGVRGAVVTGVVCALWFELIYFAPAVLSEVIAAHCAIVAVWLGDDAAQRERRLLAAGALFGLAILLRMQYAPALLAVALWQYRLDLSRWKWLVLGGLAVMLPLGGVLDALTWGAPFQSLWLNLVRNSLQGVASSWSTQPWSYYAQFELAAWQLAAPLAVLVLLGAWRAPAFALMALVVLFTHSVVPHKEYRFIYLALACAPIFVGLGIATIITWIERYRGVAVARGALAALLLFCIGSSGYAATHGILAARWHWLRADIAVFLAAHDRSDICALAVKDIPRFGTGGYTYLDRNVPLYLWDFTPSDTKPGSAVPFRLSVVLNNQVLAQYPGEALARAASRYNYLVAAPDHGEPGYTAVACFKNAYNPELPREVCLFQRPGGCDR